MLPLAGLWVELQLVYTGALQMTLQTKFNLSKLGKEGAQDADCTAEAGNPRSVAHRELNPLYGHAWSLLLSLFIL